MNKTYGFVAIGCLLLVCCITAGAVGAVIYSKQSDSEGGVVNSANSDNFAADLQPGYIRYEHTDDCSLLGSEFFLDISFKMDLPDDSAIVTCADQTEQGVAASDISYMYDTTLDDGEVLGYFGVNPYIPGSVDAPAIRRIAMNAFMTGQFGGDYDMYDVADVMVDGYGFTSNQYYVNDSASDYHMIVRLIVLNNDKDNDESVFIYQIYYFDQSAYTEDEAKDKFNELEDVQVALESFRYNY